MVCQPQYTGLRWSGRAYSPTEMYRNILKVFLKWKKKIVDLSTLRAHDILSIVNKWLSYILQWLIWWFVASRVFGCSNYSPSFWRILQVIILHSAIFTRRLISLTGWSTIIDLFFIIYNKIWGLIRLAFGLISLRENVSPSII